MEERVALFEEEFVENSVASAFKYFSIKGYNIRPRKRVPISQKSNVAVIEHEVAGVNNVKTKEKYKELARVFHGSKPAKKNETKIVKRAKLSFELPAEIHLKQENSKKPKTRLFGFT